MDDKKENWEVYIIQADNGKLYTGITRNLDKRFKDHLESKNGAKFFRFSRPKKIVFRESHPNKSEALKKESKIKKMNRALKLKLIHS